MKETLGSLLQSTKVRYLRTLVIVITSVAAVFAVVIFVFYPTNRDNATNNTDNESADNNSGGGLVVAVVGAENTSVLGNVISNNSWPGEIISLNNLQVQPGREGTISEWYVRIGERVYAGQVIGKLSRPPQTPEMVSMLSEKFEDLSGAQTSIVALRTYTAKRILQLQQLRIDTENSNKQKMDLLGSNTSAGDDPLLSSIASKRKMAQVILRRSITNTFPIIYGQNNIPPLKSFFDIRPRSMFGVIDSDLRNTFPDILFEALSDLQNGTIVPEKSGLLYFDTTIRLANASMPDGETLTEADITLLKELLIEDQSEFVAVLGEIKSMELERVDTQRESIDTLADIDAMIAELEKELAIAEGEIIAQEKAYASINESITSGYSMVAPNSGIVSSIMKTPGEFVGPGMPVATVTSYGNDNELVRMRIPSNAQKPKIGESLSIVRPGFGTNVQKARLIGVGSSLDDDGSYMADAVFIEPTTWSVGASVRVLAPGNSSSVLIKYSSILWEEGGAPTVWAVSEADRIFKQEIMVGRTLGASIEVYEGLHNGDRYIANPTPNIREDMFLDDLIKASIPKEGDASAPATSGEDKDMGEMEM